MNRNGYWARRLYGIFDHLLLPFAHRYHLQPNHCSWFGLALSGVAGFFFAYAPLVGAMLLIIAGGCDIADGYLARKLGRESRAGAFLDSILDRYGEMFIFAGIWGRLYRLEFDQVWSTLIILAALGGSLLVSYARARGEGLGVSCTTGRFQRGERLLILIAAGLLDFLKPGAFCLLGVGIIAIGSHVTALRRFHRIYTELDGS
jgi:CDP-diacylglycerol--glycerol-3-phosphate 3-phosphatidyltransferase